MLGLQSVSSRSRHMPKSTFARNPITKPICIRRLKILVIWAKFVTCPQIYPRKDNVACCIVLTIIFPKHSRLGVLHEEEGQNREEKPNYRTLKHSGVGWRWLRENNAPSTIHRVYPLFLQCSEMLVIYWTIRVSTCSDWTTSWGFVHSSSVSKSISR